MQNQSERTDEHGITTTVTLYHEYKEPSGFVVRELPETKNPLMKFQAGHYAMKPMQIPVYSGVLVTHHISGDEIQKFELHGFGRTKDEALINASNKMIRRDIKLCRF
jgi:hypothetical protein